LIVAACSSKKPNVTLDKKHKPLPDYVLNSSEKIQETYIMVSNYPEVVSKVPCYCGCSEQDGHKSNLDCYIDHFGKNN
ncbi:PCYCGC motif-containing (lipo)protein, partial [Alkalihalophilus pseudofirmus]